jgi:methylmalonyl-CoA mutase N-terminal domain/subunit
MASALGGVQSMFTAAWDEPFALPTEATTTLALRTQQILAYETGVARTADPLGGSYYVEALTDAMEERIVALMAELEGQGGMVEAIESGYVQRLIAQEAYRSHKATEAGEHVIVGVNRFASQEPPHEVQMYELDAAGRRRQIERLSEVKGSRDHTLVRQSLAALETAAGTTNVNLMPLLIDCAQAYCTVGEMVEVLKNQWGEFIQPTVF